MDDKENGFLIFNTNNPTFNIFFLHMFHTCPQKTTNLRKRFLEFHFTVEYLEGYKGIRYRVAYFDPARVLTNHRVCCVRVTL